MKPLFVTSAPRRVVSSRISSLRIPSLALTASLLAAFGIIAASGQAAPQAPEVKATGVSNPSVRHDVASLHAITTLQLPLNPDWFTVAGNSIWVTSSRSNVVTQIVGQTNQIGLSVKVQKPCSGLAFGFDSLWIPSCGGHSVVRVDPATGKTIAEIAAGPAESEGGITVGAGSVWIVTDKAGVLSRIDVASNTVKATIKVLSGSFNPLFADGYIWVTSNEHSELIKVDPATNTVVGTIQTGKNPRFLTYGDGCVWTLNQGDGTISRIDTKTAKNLANIEAGLAGEGGEITFGFGSAWATLFGFPITRISAATNTVTDQWTGEGGDSIRAALGSIWLTNYKSGAVMRFAPGQK
jgi:virginiamycin B lyase